MGYEESHLISAQKLPLIAHCFSRLGLLTGSSLHCLDYSGKAKDYTKQALQREPIFNNSREAPLHKKHKITRGGGLREKKKKKIKCKGTIQ